VIAFGVESVATLRECVDLYAALWAIGPGKQGEKYDPDLDALASAVVSGRAFGVCARKDGKLVAGQMWWLVQEFEQRTITTGLMTAIGRLSDDVDLTEFMRFGIKAARARGANRIVLQIHEGIPSLIDAAKTVGARPADRLMVLKD